MIGHGQLAQLNALGYYRGRVALFALLKALDIGPGTSVLLQAFTCVAVPEAILATGATPIYVDVEPQGLTLDADDLARKLRPDSRAVVVQHTYGIPAALDRIMAVTGESLPILEDCCHSLVSRFNGAPVGSFGVASFYSFEWGKPIVAGIGGGAVVNNEPLRHRMLQHYHQFRPPSPVRELKLQLQYLAHKLLYRPRFYWPIRRLYHLLGTLGAAESSYNPVSPALVADDFEMRIARRTGRRLRRQLLGVQAHAAHSRRVAEQYRLWIESAAVRPVATPTGAEVVYARYPLLAEHKQQLLARARRAGVELSEWYSSPVHPLRREELAQVQYPAGSCPEAEHRCRQIVTLPTSQVVSTRDIDRAVRFLNTVGQRDLRGGQDEP